MSQPLRLLSIALLCLIWGSTWPIIKVGLGPLPPFLGAGCRFAVASLLLFTLARVQHVPFPRTRLAHLGLLLHGLSGIGLSYGAVYWGEQYIPSGLSAVLFSTHPFFVMLLAHLAVAGERISGRKAIGVGLGFAGVLIIFQDDLQFSSSMSLVGAAVTLLAPLAAAVSNVAIKKWGGHLHPYNLTSLPMAYGAVGLLTVSCLTEDHSAVAVTPLAITSVFYLAIVGSGLAFVVYYSLLKQVAVSMLALVAYTFPVLALLLGYLVLGETLQPQVLAGAGTIVAGIAVATRPMRARATARTA